MMNKTSKKYTMKTRALFITAVAVFVAASCAQKVSDTTKITGDLGPGVAKQVKFSLREAGIDTTVAVSGGKFNVELPACQTGLVRIAADNIVGSFISDGTPLTFTLNEDKSFNIVSKYPKVSTHTKYDAFQQKMKDLQKTYEPQIQAAANEEAEDKLYESYQSDVKDLSLAAIRDNNDNIVAVAAIENLRYLLDTDQLDSVITTLGPAAAEAPSVKKLTKVIAAKKATEAGMMFADFEVGGNKFSDYVGKGKYVLVDFWASWCGPCKAEVPNIKNVYEKYSGNDFEVLGVAVWDKPLATAKAIKDLELPWNQIVNAQSIPTDIYGIEGIPHIILFGPDGKIVKRNLRGDEIEAEVAKYVKPVK